MLFSARNAKARLTEESWKQGAGTTCDQWNTYPGDCVLTALGRAAMALDFDWSQWIAEKRLLARLATGTPAGSVADWNDTPGRTLAEVHALYDAAIALVEQQDEVLV